MSASPLRALDEGSPSGDFESNGRVGGGGGGDGREQHQQPRAREDTSPSSDIQQQRRSRSSLSGSTIHRKAMGGRGGHALHSALPCTDAFSTSQFMELTRTERCRLKLEKYWFITLFLVRRSLRWCSLYNLALIFVAVLAIMTAVKGPRYMMGEDDVTGNGDLARVDQHHHDPILEMERRIQAVRTEQERLQALTRESLNSLELQMHEKMSSVREEMNQQLSQIRSALEETSQNTTEEERSSAASREKLELAVLTMEQRLESSLTEMKGAMEKVEETMKTVNEHSSLMTSHQKLSTGKEHNLASRKNGASVMSSFTSPQLIVGSVFHRAYARVWAADTLQWPVVDRSHLNSGEAFCFDGLAGTVAIRLSVTAASVTSVQYEHDYWTSLDAVPISAPKQYDVKVCSSTDGLCSWTLAGSCTYGADGGPVQRCQLETPSPVTNAVLLDIHSNHGQNYTCIYSIKVFGSISGDNTNE